jgi:malate dehydrogenase (oxaloacetate-decarboxylating)(NADP+)
MDTGSIRTTEEEALQFHSSGRPGKLSIAPTKPLTTQRDLSLAYSPGVAFPCLSIHREPSAVFDYTSKGNFVAVISNGTAVLGLGDLGALAAKPVMEGKAALFKRFADIDSIDLEIDTRDVDEFVNCVRFLHPAFAARSISRHQGARMLVIEERLRELLDIPVFHDDQHGPRSSRRPGDQRLHSPAAPSTRSRWWSQRQWPRSPRRSLKTMGLPSHNVVLCDTRASSIAAAPDGYAPMEVGPRQIGTKAHPQPRRSGVPTSFFGLSAKGAVDQMVRSMARSRSLRDGQPRSRDHPRTCAPCARRDHRHRASIIPTRSTTCSGSPIFAAPSTCAPGRQRGDEDRRRRSSGPARPRDVPDEVAAHSHRPAPDLWARLHRTPTRG